MTSKSAQPRPRMSIKKPSMPVSTTDIDDLLGSTKSTNSPETSEKTSSKTSKRLGAETSKRPNSSAPIGHVERVGEARRRRTVYMPPDLDLLVAQAAAQQGMRVSDFITEVLREHLDV